MNIQEQIKMYHSSNEQEKKDQEFILKMMNEKDIFERKNTVAHFTASAWVTNPSHTKVLMIYHRIYDSWSWMGGHADGCEDLFEVAKKELKEESGLNSFSSNGNIFSLEVLPVKKHIKKDRTVESHVHLNVTYLFEIDENEPLKVNLEETKGIQWISLNELKNKVKETWMLENIYSKLILKMHGGTK